MASPLYLTILIGPMVAVPAPKPLIDALVSAEVTVSAVGKSGFSLTFTLANNSPLQTLFMLTGGAPIPLLRVILVVTLGGLPQVIADGVIKHHEITPDAMGGSSQLTIIGEDLTAVMDLVDFSGLPYPAMTPDLRVLTILAKYAAFGIIPVVLPVVSPDVPIPVERTPSQKDTDLSYIQQLANDAGYVFYIEPGPAPGTNTAYWGPQVRIGIPQPALNVNMDTWTNVESLNFRYEPQSSVTPLVYIQEPITKTTIPIPMPSLNPLDPPLGALIPLPQKIEQIKDTAKLTPADALMAAISRSSQTSDIVSGDGTLDVLRYGQPLKARGLVGVRGAGTAFDGLHYVESTTHRIKLGQYKQSFTLKRNGLVSTVPVVPAVAF
jgi:hypothetical protein